MKYIFLFCSVFLLAACAQKAQHEAPFSLLIPKQIIYQTHHFELSQSNKQKTQIIGFTYTDKSNQQLHFLLSEFVMGLEELQEALADGVKEKGYQIQFKRQNNILYAQTKMEKLVKNTVSKNTSCGTLTVFKNSAKSTALLAKDLALTLDQFKCEKN